MEISDEVGDWILGWVGVSIRIEYWVRIIFGLIDYGVGVLLRFEMGVVLGVVGLGVGSWMVVVRYLVVQWGRVVFELVGVVLCRCSVWWWGVNFIYLSLE